MDNKLDISKLKPPPVINKCLCGKETHYSGFISSWSGNDSVDPMTGYTYNCVVPDKMKPFVIMRKNIMELWSYCTDPDSMDYMDQDTTDLLEMAWLVGRREYMMIHDMCILGG
jgi:hypothetical protein